SVVLPSTSVVSVPRPSQVPPAAKTKPGGPPTSGVTPPLTSAGPQPPPRPAVKPPPEPKIAKPPAAPKRCWALVTDSFRRKQNAEYTARLRRKLGLMIHPVTRVRVRGRWWYRVILGCFASREAARRYGDRLHKNGETRDRPQVISVRNVKRRGGS
ncbi:MAG: SPOR domain-containing protein, partial [Proteobacteria bacterium]|nr:SPOR domain-containing protein [Pseudomonadota bacterium]